MKLRSCSTATVSIATVDESDQAFAVKSAELSQSEFLQKEQSILFTLRPCPQIIAYKGFEVTEEYGKLFYNIFLEYAPAGTLTDAIRLRGGCLEEGIIRSYTREILLGLHHLHSNGIIHSDIKCHNILVTSDGPKLADFGCARRVDQFCSATARTTIAGTPIYMAPEVARGEHQGFPADVWALGCAVVEMATGRAPWTNISDPVSAIYQIGFSDKSMPEIPSFMSKQGKDFISKCLKRDPVERWSASELLNHSFIAEEGFNVDSPTSVLKEINVDSPTSVLEHQELSLWDPNEEVETTWKWTHKSKGNPHSPIERISKLAQTQPRVPNWESDDNWITVRGKDSTQEKFGSFVDANQEMGNSYTLGGEYVSINSSHDELISTIGLPKINRSVRKSDEYNEIGLWAAFPNLMISGQV
ncbi:hypothetical protein JCGZ_21190 [Jatropha curcas]|uniref:Protein kinase domain-containing protein n=1 Tax=Jatropha curcas TaxID=180498 RepID=A0A067JMK8_JATCU|nr:hypothetical protein JCGZ_21190 [Jatropha curcas]